MASPSDTPGFPATAASPSYVLSLGGGPDDRMTVIGGPLGSNTLTFECWLNMSTAPGVAEASQTLMYLFTQDGGSPRLDYLGGDKLSVYCAGQSYPSADTRPVSDGAWHHVALVISSGIVTLYKDGAATADTIQLPSSQNTFSGELSVGCYPGSTRAFNGELHDIRVWDTARTTAQISSYRYVTLTGKEPGLADLIGFPGPQYQVPVNLVRNTPGQVTGNVVGVPAQLPQQPLPVNVWTYPVTGEVPVGPALSAQGLLCTDNSSGGTFLRSVDLNTGQVSWTYDAQAHTYLTAGIIPKAVGLSGQTAFVGVQEAGLDPRIPTLEIHPVDITTGALVSEPVVFPASVSFLTRPAVLAGSMYVGMNRGDNYEQGADRYAYLYWGDPADQDALSFFSWQAPADSMTDPVLDGTSIYVGTTYNGACAVTAIPAAGGADPEYTWQVPTPAAITADLTLGSAALYVPAGGTVLALNTADGSTLWSHELSGSPVQSRPALIGSTLYAGSTDGILYALDAVTGAEQWRVDTGSAITTDLINEDGVLYFANAGDGTPDRPPAFLAVDTNSNGNDVLGYAVPQADTILFDQGGVTNGVAYFYGAQNVYAVNMSNVIREFAVNSKLIVEDYDTSTSNPIGSNTSYRVTLTLRDENGMARPNQVVKLWSSGTLHVINQGETATLTSGAPAWQQTDASGNLTLALSAFDDGTPDGTPNVACPPLYAWANFMASPEAIVIFPDHESLTSLAAVQGTSGSAAALTDGGPAPRFLDQATGYDGSALILPGYQDPDSLTAIASTVRNTIGTRNPAAVGAPLLTGQRQATPSRYVRAGAVIPNVIYTPDAAASPVRPYVPGADPVFTVDLSGGQPVYTAGTFDPASPAGFNSPRAAELGSIFHDIKDFVSKVIKGAESVVKMAWQFAEDAVQTVIHTAESIYTLVITDLEDAITAVVGFFKSVAADVKKVIQWLSTLFKWDNILKNHTYIKKSITNPGDTANPGILDRLASWVDGQVKGGSTDAMTVLNQLSGRSSAAVGDSAQSTAGQTVQSQQAGNNDPNAVYNTGSNNNANQCTWMNQKVQENSAGGTVGGGSSAALGAAWDAGTITTAFDQFLAAVAQALEQSFEDFPEQIQQKLASTMDSFKDPKSVLSTGLSDLLTVFQTLADDLVDFAKAVAADFLQLLDTLLAQIVSWINDPVDIPFVSALYHALTGDQLSVLDLACLLAAVPGTILLDVITGSPTVPETQDVGREASTPSGELAGRILLGIVNFALGEVGAVLDIMTMDWSAEQPDWFTPVKPGSPPNPIMTFLSRLDFAIDFISYSLGMAGAYGWSTWEAQDWVFWSVQSVPQMCNFAYMFRDDGTGKMQAARDTVFGFGFLVCAAVYAAGWPATYRDAGNAKGLVLSANVFSFTSSICEVLMLLLNPWDWMPVEGAVKIILYTVGNGLGFAANVVGLVS